ncbi:MAG: ABC-F family ATP-binding cassette domain-containing protein, partial [Oscillospiraceae bacterium]|nr:ABC-F family ATP-binding cassette domain-containing protein [Oscillospiraceae bacterium]
MLLTADSIHKNYGMKQLLRGVTLYVEAGHKIGIIGVNGTGKSTLLKLLAGAEEPDEGRVKTDPGVRVAYLPQAPAYREADTVLQHVLSVLPEEERALREYEAKTVLNRLGVGLFERTMGSLSGGQRKRAALAAVLLQPSDVLLLDEPTNHLDTEMINWLEQFLVSYAGGLVMVTHDRYFLQNVCNRIVELSLAASYEYEANWERYLELKLQRQEIAEASEQKRQNLLRIERAWMMRGARARSTKNKAHIQRYEELRDREGPEMEQRFGDLAAGASRLGRKTIELIDVSKAYDGKAVIKDFSYMILRNDRVGIVGHNGAGKSTLLNLIAERTAPDSGSLDRGSTVKVGYFTQESGHFDSNQTAIEYIKEIAPYLDTTEGRLSATVMLERFLFGSDLQYSKIGKLSGGERRRLFLLGILMSAPNVLLLDEPTNDLDIDTLTVLEAYLQEFPGAVLAVSHDRYFLDKVAEHIFEVTGDGRVNRYVGSYTDYLSQVKSTEKAAAAPAKPKAEGERRRTEKLKFSFKEQKEFETIDADIAATEDKIRQVEEAEKTSASDYVRLQELMEEKEALTTELDRLMERWMYLNELNERIEAEKALLVEKQNAEKK